MGLPQTTKLRQFFMYFGKRKRKKKRAEYKNLQKFYN